MVDNERPRGKHQPTTTSTERERREGGKGGRSLMRCAHAPHPKQMDTTHRKRRGGRYTDVGLDDEAGGGETID